MGELKPEQTKRIKRYWNYLYGETVEEEILQNADPNYLKSIVYAGEFTDDEWKEHIRNARKDFDGEPVIDGEPL